MDNQQFGTGRSLALELFEEPDNFPGASTCRLSPREAWEFAEPCGPYGSLSGSFGLVEEPVKTITKRGIRLYGRFYIHEYLLPWTTGESEDQPGLFLRYDRSLAARGVLREVELLREHPDGSRRVVAVCVRDVDFAERCSFHEFHELRREALNRVIKDQEKLERIYLNLELHEDAVEDFYAAAPIAVGAAAAGQDGTEPWRSAGGDERESEAERQAAVADALMDDRDSPDEQRSASTSGPEGSGSPGEPDQGGSAADMLSGPSGSGLVITHDGKRRGRRRRRS